jgi:hypothetical protein
VRPELDHPTPHCLAAGLDPALRKQFLNVADAEREAEIQPHRVADHVRREPVALERDRFHEFPRPWRGRPPQTGDALAFACQHPYEHFPRGRIVYHRPDQVFWIYADRRVQAPQKIAEVVRVFGLEGEIYEVRSDAHYR